MENAIWIGIMTVLTVTLMWLTSINWQKYNEVNSNVEVKPEHKIVPQGTRLETLSLPKPDGYRVRSLEIYRELGDYNNPDKVDEAILRLLPELDDQRLYMVTCMLWGDFKRYTNYPLLLEKGLEGSNAEFYHNRIRRMGSSDPYRV